MSELEELNKSLEMVKKQRAVLQRQLDEFDEIIAVLPRLIRIMRDTLPSEGAGSDSPHFTLSVFNKVVKLLEEDENIYTIGEIFDEWTHRGDPIQGVHPKNALRTAISEAVKKGRLTRLGDGKYVATKWLHPSQATGVPHLSQDGEPGGWPDGLKILSGA
jgi:hypothetical protein